MNFDLTHLVWTTILTLIISHFAASYLSSITPRGYMFWFTIVSFAIGLFLM